jgi:hypothetical protein
MFITLDPLVPWGDQMRLVCMHADTVDALKRLSIQFDDLTPAGLWSSQYHLIGLTPEQIDALEVFQVQVEDVTPAQLAQAGGRQREDTAREATAGGRAPTQTTSSSAPTQGVLAGAMAVPQAAHEAAVTAPTATAGADQGGREASRGSAGTESEVPLAQARDAGSRAGEGKAEPKPDTKAASQSSYAATTVSSGASAGGSAQQVSGQKSSGGKGGTGAGAPAQAGRKGQPQGGGQGGQRYGTTRLRISVAGKYTEATVANGKIVVAGRSFDSPDQAAAELTKSRGDWTFWEYYDSTDGKWRMLTRDWDSVLKSAAPGGR